MEKKEPQIVRLNRNDKHQRLVELLGSLSQSEFTGYLKVNFSQGGIGRIEKFEEIPLHREAVR